jgi:hypothetical protein
MTQLRLSAFPAILSVCRLESGSPVPAWALQGEFSSLTCTKDEISIVCAQDIIPPGVQVERGWRVFKVEGPLDFALIGILANLSSTLAQAGISIFAISTYDTDYILVREADFSKAVRALREAGHSVVVAA